MNHPFQTPPRRGGIVVRLLAGVLAVLPAAVGSGQGMPWNWGLAANPTANWSAEQLADYMLTGHTPHPAVARIVAPEQSGTSLGSGVLVDVNRSQGLVLTNWHVIRDSRSAVLVQFPDGFQSAGTVVRWDEAWDLAALVIWKPQATPVPIAAAPPAIGETLTIAGFGRGVYREESGGCTEYLSPGNGYAKEFVELKATARQGDSGGPIFNDRRELSGVLFGQNEGRTIGSCSTRGRTFLASVGSRGFTPSPIGEFSDARAVDRGIGTAAPPQDRLAAAGDGVMQRSTYVAAPLAAAPGVGQLAPVAPPLVQPPATAPLGPWPSALGPQPTWLEEITAHSHLLLPAAGGLALVVLGLRTLFGGRRRTG